jgi:hypothetical protein
MTLNDEDLRRLYRSYIVQRTDVARQHCPSITELARFFEPRIRIRAKMKIVDHITACPACAEEFEFLRKLKQYREQVVQRVQEIRTDESSSAHSPSVHKRLAPLWRYSSVIAGILLAIASVFIIAQKWGRHGETRAVPRSVILLQPDPRHPGHAPLVFKWREFRGANAYTLELFDDALLPIWKSPEIGALYLNLPDDILRKFTFGKPYFWMITAYRNGDKVAESELARFDVVPKNR